MAEFTEVPVIDWSLSQGVDKPKFLAQLRHALVNIGFLYLDNHSVPKEVVERVKSFIPGLFALRQEEKDAISMANSEHFLGYTRLGAELTRGATDQREQYDFATDHQCLYKEGRPEFLKLWGEAQWPKEESLPGFKATMKEYLSAVEALSYNFTQLMSESLGLGPNGLDQFFDERSKMQHRCKVVQYPSLDKVSSSQGVGPHFDAGFLTFLLQASPHQGLQVQNSAGSWIDVPPIDGTFVVNIGKGLEAVSRKVCLATSHRVLSPPPGSTRYSMPFFQNISQTVRLADHLLTFPDEIMKMRNARGGADGSKAESVNFSEYDYEQAGLVNLIGRVKSHPDVAERHYPQLFHQYFPNGRPTQASVY